MSRENSKKINFSVEDVRDFQKEVFGKSKELASAMGISPPNLTQYLTGKREFGALFRERLDDVGFFDWLIHKKEKLIKDELINDPSNVKGESVKSSFIDIAGAIELSNTPASRLAQLLSVPAATLTAWQNGTEKPTTEQLVNLFNLVVALGLSSRTTTSDKTEQPPAQATA